jgi:hypothetical protein
VLVFRIGDVHHRRDNKRRTGCETFGRFKPCKGRESVGGGETLRNETEGEYSSIVKSKERMVSLTAICPRKLTRQMKGVPLEEKDMGGEARSKPSLDALE